MRIVSLPMRCSADVLDLDLLKSGLAHSKGDLQQRIFLAQKGKNFGSKMQPGRWSRNGTRVAGVDGLVAVEIEAAAGGGLSRLALDIGRQRRIAMLEHPLVLPVEKQQAPAALTDGEHLGARPAIADEFGAGSEACGRLAKNLEFSAAKVPHDQHLRHLAADPTQQARRAHAGIVHDQEITGAEQAGKVAETMVGDRAALAVETQQPRAVAVLGREAGDQFLRQIKIKFGEFHRCKNIQ